MAQVCAVRSHVIMSHVPTVGGCVQAQYNAQTYRATSSFADGTQSFTAPPLAIAQAAAAASDAAAAAGVEQGYEQQAAPAFDFAVCSNTCRGCIFHRPAASECIVVRVCFFVLCLR